RGVSITGDAPVHTRVLNCLASRKSVRSITTSTRRWCTTYSPAWTAPSRRSCAVFKQVSSQGIRALRAKVATLVSPISRVATEPPARMASWSSRIDNRADCPPVESSAGRDRPDRDRHQRGRGMVRRLLLCRGAVVPVQRLPVIGRETGLEVGLTVFLSTAEGEVTEHPRPYRTAEREFKTAQRLSRGASRATNDAAKPYRGWP